MKHLLTFLLIASCTLMLQAQVTSSLTVDLPSAKIPSGYTVPVLDELDDPTVIKFRISLDATTHDNATRLTAFTSMLTGLKTEIDSNQVFNVWNLDTNAVTTMNIVVKNYTRGFTLFEVSDPLDILLADEDVFILSGYVAYIKEPE